MIGTGRGTGGVVPAPAGPSTWLTAERRVRELSELAEGPEIDVLVIGGGVTGAGVALDAASRGLSVALVERRDLANGASRWSSKLAHGGLRYLANGQFGVAWESARERQTLATVSAPHLIRPLPQLIPVLSPQEARSVALLEVGIRMGDAMRALAGTSRRRLAAMRRIGPAEAALWAPGLVEDGVRGAILSWDAQLEDDARLVVAVARTAAAYGARIITRCEVVALTGAGAQVRDGLSGDGFELRARHVVNATGVWAGELVEGIELRPSRGSHLLVAAERLGNPRAMLNVPLPGRFGRFVFAVPRQDGLVMIGLTDEPHTAATIPDEPQVPAADEAFLLESLGRALRAPLTTADVVGRFAGLRPLLASGQTATADISRRHAVLEDPRTGAITVVGGKLTTYRQMAEDAVDRIAARGGERIGSCPTARLRLVGSPSPGWLSGHPGLPGRLLRRFGAEAAELAALAASDPELLEPVPGAGGVLRVELLAAVQREGALTVADVTDRRTRSGFVPEWRAAVAAAAEALVAEPVLALSPG